MSEVHLEISKHFYALAELFSTGSFLESNADEAPQPTVQMPIHVSKPKDCLTKTPEALALVDTIRQELMAFHLRPGTDERGMNAAGL